MGEGEGKEWKGTSMKFPPSSMQIMAVYTRSSQPLYATARQMADQKWPWPSKLWITTWGTVDGISDQNSGKDTSTCWAGDRPNGNRGCRGPCGRSCGLSAWLCGATVCLSAVTSGQQPTILWTSRLPFTAQHWVVAQGLATPGLHHFLASISTRLTRYHNTSATNYCPSVIPFPSPACLPLIQEGVYLGKTLKLRLKSHGNQWVLSPWLRISICLSALLNGDQHNWRNHGLCVFHPPVISYHKTGL